MNEDSIEAVQLEMFDRYEHHGQPTWVRKDLKGGHRAHCLCFMCRDFIPEPREANCPIANEVFKNCVDYGIVTPVWECPIFRADNGLIPQAILHSITRWVNPDRLGDEMAIESAIDDARAAMADLEMVRPELFATGTPVGSLLNEAVVHVVGLAKHVEGLTMAQRLATAAALILQAIKGADEMEQAAPQDGDSGVTV